MLKLSLRGWALGAAGMVLLVAAAAAEDLAPEQVLHRGNGAEPATLDPAKSEAVPDMHIEDDLYENLVTLGKDNRPAPAAAASWETSADGRTITFHIRPGLKWSDGAPLTAADFVYSWRRAIDPATGSRYGFLYFPVKNAEAIVDGRIRDVTRLGVRAPDPSTFEVTLEAPTAYFVAMTAHQIFAPVERADVEKYGTAFTRPGNLVSNGAFTLEEWTPQSRIVLVKNPYFHAADKVKLTRVIYYPIENEDEELKRYRGGELDITNDVPDDQVDMVRREMAGEFVSPPYYGLYFVGFNVTRPPFKDAPKLRNALSMVLDREAITRLITKHGEAPAYGFVPPGIPGYQPQSVPWRGLSMPERIAEAKRLYQESGYGPDRPLKLELRYNTSANHKKVMIAVAGMWKQRLGVETSLVNEEFKVFLETRKERKITEAYRDAWIGDYPDPNAFAQLLLSNSGQNNAGYANPDYDALVAQAAATADPGERALLLEQAERLVLRDAPVAPLYDYVNQHMVKPYVRGYAPDLIGYAYSKDIWLAKH